MGAEGGGLTEPVWVCLPSCRRSPLWDQEDVYSREGCIALTAVSMPFYWPPRQGGTWEGHLLPIPQQQEHHPTFGAMAVAGGKPISHE